MAFRIGSIEIGVSADISNAIRSLRQVGRELGTFDRLQQRFVRNNSARDAVNRLKADRNLLRGQAEALRLQQEQVKAAKALNAEMLSVEQTQAKILDQQFKARRAPVNQQFADERSAIADLRRLAKLNENPDGSPAGLTQADRIQAARDARDRSIRLRSDIAAERALREEEAARLLPIRERITLLQREQDVLARRAAGLSGLKSQLDFQLRINASKLEQARLDQQAADALARQAELTKNIRDTLIGAAAAFATGTLANVVGEATILAARVENLGTILRNVGQVAGYNEAQLGFLEERVKSLGITTQAARQSLALLALNEQDLAQSTQLARIAQDAAAIAAIDSSEATTKLITAIERLDTRSLRTLGIVVNLRQVYAKYAAETGKSAETLSAAEKQQLLLNEVLRRGANIAGTYEAALQDSFKQLTTLNRLTEELQRSFGEAFIPVFEAGVKAITALVGKTEEDGLRAVVAQNRALIAAMTTFAVVGGTSIAVTKALTLAAGALGVTMGGGVVRGFASAVSGTYAYITATGAAAHATRALGVALLSPAGLVIGLAAGAAGLIYYATATREAAKAEQARVDKIKQTTQRLYETKEALDVVRTLGGFTSRTADQQEKFNAAIDKVIGLLPEYSSRLKAVRTDTAAFLKVAEQAFNGTGFRGNDDAVRAGLERQRQALESEATSLLSDAERSSVSALTKAGQKGALQAFIEGNGSERMKQIAAALKDLTVVIDQFDQAVTSSKLQSLDDIFAKQQEAVGEALRLTKDFEQSRVESIKGANFEIIKDFVKLQEVMQTQFLSLEQIRTRERLRIQSEEARLRANYQGSLAEAREKLQAAKIVGDAAGQATARRELEAIEEKLSGDIAEARRNAAADAEEAIKQAGQREAVERKALQTLEERIRMQREESDLTRKENALENTRREGISAVIASERELLKIRQQRQAFESFFLNSVQALWQRYSTFISQQNHKAAEEVLRSIQQFGRLRTEQLREFEEQARAARDAATRAREDAKREVDNFIKDTSGRLGSEFRADGTLRVLQGPFRELAVKVSEARQQLRQATDGFIAQARQVQSPEQLGKLGKLFKQDQRASLDEERKKLSELIAEEEKLRFASEFGISEEDANKRRGELAEEIQKQRNFIFEMADLQKEEAARFQQEQERAVAALALLGNEAALTNMIANDEERALQAARERLVVQQGIVQSKGGTAAIDQVSFKTGSRLDFKAPSAPGPRPFDQGGQRPIDPLAGLDTAPISPSGLDALLRESGAATYRGLEELQEAFKVAVEGAKESIRRIDKVAEEVRREREAASNAFRSKGLKK
jgi:hypothetical protein